MSQEPEHVLTMYGPEVHKTGSFARNCLLARRMIERDVRFVQLFHRGWDHHVGLPKKIRGQAYDVDQPASALIKDLKLRGLLGETLVVFGEIRTYLHPDEKSSGINMVEIIILDVYDLDGELGIRWDLWPD